MTAQDKQDVIEWAAIAICRQSGHAPNGTCAARCMDQLGDVPAKGCHHAKLIHGAKAEAAIRVVLEDFRSHIGAGSVCQSVLRDYAASIGIKLTPDQPGDEPKED